MPLVVTCPSLTQRLRRDDHSFPSGKSATNLRFGSFTNVTLQTLYIGLYERMFFPEASNDVVGVGPSKAYLMFVIWA
ncbi:MAG: hypothetical protein JWP89_6948 [Schlesneria sp.]|nr:hypothetical protein [Schlesneria sp.]